MAFGIPFLPIPSTIGGVVALLVDVVVIWVAVVVADKIIAHNIEPKRSAILAFLAYFISPVVLAFAKISVPFAGIIVPLIVWVVLSEVLLQKSAFKDRLKVAAVAFVIYLILTLSGVPGAIAGMIAV